MRKIVLVLIAEKMYISVMLAEIREASGVAFSPHLREQNTHNKGFRYILFAKFMQVAKFSMLGYRIINIGTVLNL